jgi:hypothetical protein
MLHHIHFTKRIDMTALPAIREQFMQRGGRVVLFQRVASAILVSWESAHLEWIPPHSTRTYHGLRHVLWTGLLGWWSLPGLFHAQVAILTNIFGGVDVTDLVTGPPPLPGRTPEPIERARALFQSRFGYVVILELILFFGGICAWIACTPAWRPPVSGP